MRLKIFVLTTIAAVPEMTSNDISNLCKSNMNARDYKRPNVYSVCIQLHNQGFLNRTKRDNKVSWSITPAGSIRAYWEGLLDKKIKALSA